MTDRSGYAYITDEGHAEFHSLGDVTKNLGSTIPVKKATLDELAAEYAWDQIDVLKLDAESSEEAILRSGPNFFRR